MKDDQVVVLLAGWNAAEKARANGATPAAGAPRRRGARVARRRPPWRCCASVWT